MASYRLACLIEVGGLYPEPEQRGQARVEELLAELDVQVQHLPLKPFDPAAYGTHIAA